MTADSNQNRKFPRILTQRLILRLPDIDDISAILSYFMENKSHFATTDPVRSVTFYTEKFWTDNISKFRDAFLADKAVHMFLFDRHYDKEILGTLEFSQVSRGPFQACYLGYGIAQKWEGKGIMFEGLTAAIRFAFQEMNIHRIMANHLPENTRSARLLERLGFQKECLAKEYLRINNEWRDHVLNSLRNQEWRDKIPSPSCQMY